MTDDTIIQRYNNYYDNNVISSNFSSYIPELLYYRLLLNNLGLKINCCYFFSKQVGGFSSFFMMFLNLKMKINCISFSKYFLARNSYLNIKKKEIGIGNKFSNERCSIILIMCRFANDFFNK